MDRPKNGLADLAAAPESSTPAPAPPNFNVGRVVDSHLRNYFHGDAQNIVPRRYTPNIEIGGSGGNATLHTSVFVVLTCEIISVNSRS